MPELPEVETVCRGLSKQIKNDLLLRIETRRSGLRWPFPKALNKAKDCHVLGLERRAKYILVKLSNNQTLLLHLGMSGRMLFNPEKSDKHDHVIFHFKKSGQVVFNDPRRFGVLDIALTGQVAKHKLLASLGPEPLENNFDAAYLLQKLKNRKTPIKLAIMDQKIVVGVGNIYASEALWRAKISPLRHAGKLNAAECKILCQKIKDVLTDAIEAGGSSLKDYVQTDGELGYFQHRFSVYDRASQKCPRCKSAIEKTVQGGRSTFYCPQCQT